MYTLFDMIFWWIPFRAHISNMLFDFIVSSLKTGPIPEHVAFVMDGNRRFAKGKSLPLKEGHYAGAETLVSILDTSYRLGIHAVTIYAFSIENFNRPQAEVDTLFSLLRDKLTYLSSGDEFATKNEVKIKIIGRKSMIPEDILKDLTKIEDLTKDNKRHILNVCFPYTSRDDMTQCIKRIVNDVEVEHKYGTKDIDEAKLNSNMYFGDEYPDVDLLIRTSGHTRLSDFMLWQTNKNSVIVFDNTLWPDFRPMKFIYHLLRWSYYKNLQIQEGEKVEARNPNKQKVLLKDLSHPPYASVTGQ